MTKQPHKGDLRVWWIPQVPMKAFHVSVRSLDEAALVLDTLAAYDAFQYENLIKPDYCNAGGLQAYDPEDVIDGDPSTGWTDWYSEDGMDFDEYWAYRQNIEGVPLNEQQTPEQTRG